MKKVRWGIAGCGRISHTFAKAIANVENAELVAVASRTEKKSSEFAAEYGITNVFVGYEDMAKFDSIDAVYVATPPYVHSSVSKIFLNAKKHVMCEKSICLNAAEAIELEACATKNGVFLMEAMWMKFLPAIREAKAIVDSGVLGEIKNINVDFSALIPGERSGVNVFMNERGGGALLDLGVYGVNFVNLIMGGAPDSIYGTASLWEGIDVHTGILMKYKNGCLASIGCSLEVFRPRFAYVYGQKGCMSIPNFYGATELSLNIWDGEEKQMSIPRKGNGFEEEIEEACSCILADERQSKIHPMSDTITVLKQMDEIRRQIGVRYPVDEEVK